MTILILFSLLIGAVLGMRFRVLILGPIILTSAVAIFVGGAAAGFDLSGLSLAAVLVIVFLQIGYFSGIITRYTMALARSERIAKAPHAQLNPPAKINQWTH
jgi:hypothetical protein